MIRPGGFQKSVIRLVGVVLAEQHDEWTEPRRYMGLDLRAKARTVHIGPDTTGEDTELTAITA